LGLFPGHFKATPRNLLAKQRRIQSMRSNDKYSKGHHAVSMRYPEVDLLPPILTLILGKELMQMTSVFTSIGQRSR